jgi:hypothetical protein
MDLFVDEQALVAFYSGESCPQRAVFIAMCGEWFDCVSKALEAVG